MVLHLKVMYLVTAVLLVVFSVKASASVQSTSCHHRCICVRTSAKCDVTDDTLSSVLDQLPGDLTELDLSYNNLTSLTKDTFRRFQRLVFLSLSENSIEQLENGCLNGLTSLKELDLRSNGEHFTVQKQVFEATPSLTKLRLEGNPSITSLYFLRTSHSLREISADSRKSCVRCNYTRISKNHRCQAPRYCLDTAESPFRHTYCACASCERLNYDMFSENCTDDLHIPERIMGDKTAVRVVLWVISTLALVSNLALILSRGYTHARRQRPLSVFIVGLALSNLFVTTSVMILLIADSHQSSSHDTTALGQGTWSQSVCSPVYFLKHFGIYSLVITLTFIILERFTKLGYKVCFATELTIRRSTLYICEAWVLSFLLIIPPWTRVTTWEKFCMASYEMSFARAMYIICSLLVIAVCLSALLQAGLLLWQRIVNLKAGTRKETRTDISLILAGVLTFALLGIPHGVISIAQTSGERSGTEAVTILLALVCLLYPVLFMNYTSNDVCLSDTLSTKNMECTCGKCDVEQFYPPKYSLDSLNQRKSPVTSSYHEDYDSQRPNTKMTASAGEERMSADSLLDLDTWTSRSTKTKSWIESCDYEDLRKLRTEPWAQTPRRENSFQEVTEKPRALTWSDRYCEKSTSTSGVNDVSSIASSSSERASCSSERARSSSERERSSSDHTPSLHVPCQRHSSSQVRYDIVTTEHEGLTMGHEGVAVEYETVATNEDSEGGKTCDSGKRRSKRLSSIRGFFQRALSPKRQRSKSLPVKPELCKRKVERSQSAPFPVLDNNIQAPCSGHTTITKISPELAANSYQRTGESTYMERLASFFVLAPARSPKHPRRPILSPGKGKPVGVVSPTPSQKSSMAERLVKGLSIGRKSPSHEPASLARTITLEEGDILTELPVMRRQKLKTKPRDAMARISTGSTGSAGSTTTRYSMEWDPIGSVEGYAEREVLPPYPPLSLKHHNDPPPSQVSRPASESLALEQPKVTERTSLYSLDWDPTSVQLRNSVVSRDSLSLGDSSDDEGHRYDIEECEDKKGKTVWV